MTTFVHSFSSRQILCLEHAKYQTIRDVKIHLELEEGLPVNSYFFICDGKVIQDTELVKKDAVYHTHLRILGGKGGFGSMLRAIGAQIEKTTNHEACRDLSGRRMRDVNNEKDLKDWLAKQTEREKEREQRRQERIARRRAMPNHKFNDPLYDQQKSLLAENQEEALLTGLKKAQSRTDGSQQGACSKRKTDDAGPSGIGKKKKDVGWLGVDIEDLSDLSDEGSPGSDSGRDEQMDTQPGGSTSNDTEDSNSSEPVVDDAGVRQNTATADSSVPVSTVSGVEAARDGDSRESGEGTASSVTNTTNNGQANDSGKMADTEAGVNSGEDTEKMAEVKPFILDDVTSMEELCGLGLDVLKTELMSRGLKCGGTLEQRAERLFSVKGLSRDQIDPSLFAKSKNGKNVKGKK